MVLTKEEKINACIGFYNELCSKLSDFYEIVASCNNDISSYLIPKGSIEKLTYYGKPENSFRLSDHWNWFSSIRKCVEEHYIQCYSSDLPWVKRRPEPGKASKPIFAVSVGYYGNDNKYHVIFGERFDRKTKEWDFVTPTSDEVIERLKGELYL